MNPKLQWLRNKMSSLDMQGIIISNPINIKYLTGIDAEGTLLITRKENIYITDGRYIIFNKHRCRGNTNNKSKREYIYNRWEIHRART